MRVPLFVRHALYIAKGGFLVRPLLIALILGAGGMSLSWLEEQFPLVSAWVPDLLFPSHSDPQVAQVILAGIAGSIMTVVSIVFAILLMTLTLASMQFSPRILVNFVRDRVTQWTLGVFLGTFCYCMAALPAARYAPTPFSPVATVFGAMILALMCVGWLLFFIQHISQAISVNNIVDRIARDIEDVIDSIMPHQRTAATRRLVSGTFEEREHAVAIPHSGYIRYVDLSALMAHSRTTHRRIRVTRRVGQFVPAGFPLFMVSGAGAVAPEEAEALHRSVDIGPARTLQQDVEFGILQIVDIALRAISPAVNDPSTAINCIDQLSGILILWCKRDPAEIYLASPPHVVRVIMPWVSTSELLDTAFEQIRHYAHSDFAVSMRLVRAFSDIALCVTDEHVREDLFARGRRVVRQSDQALSAEDVSKLKARLAVLEQACRPAVSIA
jgi:uncharacterized membrane protein